MKIVIDISETLMQIVEDDDVKAFCNPVWQMTLMDAIKDGTTLPKEHGRLIDADKIIYDHAEVRYLEDMTLWHELCATQDQIISIPTVLEANKEET